MNQLLIIRDNNQEEVSALISALKYHNFNTTIKGAMFKIV